MLHEVSTREIGAARPSAPGTQLNVAIVDQIPLFREGLSVRVVRDPGMRLVGTTGHANAAVLLRDRLPVDVLVVDAVLDPRGQLSRLLTDVNSDLTVVMLVREPFRTARFVNAALAAGVHGLVLRSAPPEQILAAIRRSHTEARYVDPALVPLLAEGALTGAQLKGGPRPLSNREYQVLQLIADGLSNQGIADALVVSVETVRTHIKSLLRKLAARDRAHAVAKGFRAGLLAPGADRVPGAPGGRLRAAERATAHIPLARGGQPPQTGAGRLACP